MKRIFDSILRSSRSQRPIYRNHAATRIAAPPPGFVRRSDPNFYFLARKY
ncbi:hypothetical protein HJC99_06710 [Candidatus Saccharibacteria bacterium]|nr:hypothetical protein [Candidatus Saccharibacteria bacterium]